MISIQHLQDPNANEILPAKSMTNYMYAKPPSDIYIKQGSSSADTLSTAGDTMYTTTTYGAGSDSRNVQISYLLKRGKMMTDKGYKHSGCNS